MPLPHHGVLRPLEPFAGLDEAEIDAVLETAATHRFAVGAVRDPHRLLLIADEIEPGLPG